MEVIDTEKLDLPVTLIFPGIGSKGNPAPDADFFTMLAIVKRRVRHHRWITLDLGNESPYKEILSAIIAEKKSLLYLHVPDITLLPSLATIFSELKTLKQSNILIVTGGHTSLSVKSGEILDSFPFIDTVIRYPGAEKTLRSIIDVYYNNLDWDNVKGITYRRLISGTDQYEAADNPQNDLNGNMEHIDNLCISEEGTGSFQWYPLIISTGCTNSCQYCTNHLLFKKDSTIPQWQKKDGTQVVDELEYLLSKGIGKFHFYCDQFFLPNKQSADTIEVISKEIKQRNMKPRFRFITKPKELRENLHHLPALKEAGLAEVALGLDSGLPRFHEMYKTGSTVEDIFEVLKTLHRYRISFDIIYIFYEPYLTLDEIPEAIRFLESIYPYFSHLSLPYCAYLDSRVLSSALQLRDGIPVIDNLRKDKLVVESPGFLSHPAARFKDPLVNLFYTIYRNINQSHLRKIRHRFYNKDFVDKNPYLNLLPLRILEKILEVIQTVESENLLDFLTPVGNFVEENINQV